MGKKIFPLSYVKWAVLVLIVALVCCTGHHHYSFNQQLKQARHTIGLFKSISDWPYPIYENRIIRTHKPKQLKPREIHISEFPELYLYSTQYYFSNKMQLAALADKNHTYLLALSDPEQANSILYGLFVMLPEKKLYCLAYPQSSASKSFCQKLGATEKADVDLNWYIQVAGLDAYALQTTWENTPPLLDEPIDVWNYKK